MNLEQQLSELTKENYEKSIRECSDSQIYECVLKLVKRLAGARPAITGEKKVYYLSMEFLIGKLLGNNLINLGIYDEMREALERNGKSLAALEDWEPEPSLGNGGLGRLAACFLDSIATLGLPGDGIGLNYHFGLFRQVFRKHLQTPEKNEWQNRSGWLEPTGLTFEVAFGAFCVKAALYDISIIGYENGVNKLHLFDITTVDEGLVKGGIDFDKEAVDKNLTLFLYPDDSDEAGNLLRIYQEYFLVSCGAQFILKEIKAKGYDLHKLYEHAVIQINDTHPTMVIPELIRLLVEQEGFDIKEAIAVVAQTCAYTNHTILAEALEKWPLSYLEEVVPQLVPIIKTIDGYIKEKYGEQSVQIIDKDNRVHMAHLDIHCGFSINGVAEVHTEILKQSELAQFYKLYPEKFNNKTNGITFRRWLLYSNRELAEFLIRTIGPGFQKDAMELQKLLDFREDREVLSALAKIKLSRKKALAEYLREREGVELPVNGIFDIQIKRLHEYKRQQLNVLYIIHKYLEIKAGKLPERPLVFIFGAKAAPAYVTAQDIIHLILVLSELINHDSKINPYMRLVMVENYNVTYAERLIPACDISEQISLASKEASGTGNMKLMLNGAVTLGTRDGANEEIRELVGDDNIYIFGQDSAEVIERYKKADYVAEEYYKKDSRIRAAMDFMIGKELLGIGNKNNLHRLYRELRTKDWFMTLPDFADYVRVKDKAFADYEKQYEWQQKMLVNIAKAGFFSSDRTIAEYNRDIWKL
ncbi:MAG: glycogen/starch/alpha-glucan family phosphorylase [Roseburia sp.]|nr:glycogen/starch/alpha-glucan family phosphorylase [Roseburia sp.]